MNWPEDPATEQQLMHLRTSGYRPDHALTMIEAAALIRRLKTHPGEPAARVQMTSNENDISESTRMQVFRLRAAAEDAQRKIAGAPVGPNVRADLNVALTQRQEFWLDTCRETKEMQIASVQVFELYQKYGCRFYAPNHQQVQEIFNALDAAMPSWDKDHPELFYQTLELNFPELVKKIHLSGAA